MTNADELILVYTGNLHEILGAALIDRRLSRVTVNLKNALISSDHFKTC